MSMRWSVRKHENGLWRIRDSFGEWVSDYQDWNAAIAWAGSPFVREDYYSANPEGI